MLFRSEYSEVLAWRIKRASKDGPRKESGEKGDAEVDKEKGKGKAVEKPTEGIAPATFYGKK